MPRLISIPISSPIPIRISLHHHVLLIFIHHQDGRTPLHLAAWTGSVPIVEHLLMNGAEKEEKCTVCPSPLPFIRCRCLQKTDISYSAQQFIGGHRLMESAVELVHSSACCIMILDCPY